MPVAHGEGRERREMERESTPGVWLIFYSWAQNKHRQCEYQVVDQEPGNAFAEQVDAGSLPGQLFSVVSAIAIFRQLTHKPALVAPRGFQL
jgi:hypothetical protein